MAGPHVNGEPKKSNHKFDPFPYINQEMNAFGKISFKDEADILADLDRLPKSLPIFDLLNADLLEELETDSEERRADRLNLASTLKDQIGDLCDASTTPRDLIESFKPFFINLGQHALQAPQDFSLDSFSHLMLHIIDMPRFRPSGKDLGGDLKEIVQPKTFHVSGSTLEDLITVLDKYAESDPSLEPLVADVKAVAEREKARREAERRKETVEQSQKWEQEREDDERRKRERLEARKKKASLAQRI